MTKIDTPVQKVRPKLCRSELMLPILLWLLATCYYGGNIGKWTGDYTDAARDPVTGKVDLWKELTFFRPLGWTFAICKSGFLWNHDRLNHWISAALHGVVALLVWHFLRDLTRTPHAAMAAALVYLTFPLNYEIVFWPSAAHATVATSLFIILVFVYRGFAGGRWGWQAVVLMVVLAYLIPCWWEQPITGIVALPLLYWTACPKDEPRRTSLRRALFPVILCCLACLAYAIPALTIVSPVHRGGRESMIAMQDLGGRIGIVAHMVKYTLVGPRLGELVGGGLVQGASVLAGRRGMICLLVLALTALAWWRQFCARPLLAEGTEAVGSVRSGLLAIAFGLALFVLAWVPVVLTPGQTVETRLFYFPLIGIVLIGAVLVDWIGIALSRFRLMEFVYKSVFGVCVVMACLAGVVCLVAIQSVFRERYRMDQSEMTQLLDLVPAPAANTVFVPLRIENTAAHTGRWFFDEFAIGALATFWSAQDIVQQTYRRHDVASTYYLRWGPSPLDDIDEAGVRYNVLLKPPFTPHPAGGTRISWPTAVPLIIDRDGQVQLISDLVVERADGNDLMIPLPHVRSLLRERGLPERSYLIPFKDRSDGVEPLAGWRWETTGQPVEFGMTNLWGATHVSTGMHPSYAGERNRAAMVTTLAPSRVPSRLYFRATFTEYDLSRGRGDGVELFWYLEGRRDPPLAMLRLMPEQVLKEKRWMPVSMTVPAHEQSLILHCQVGPGEAGNWDYDACRVTIGFRQFIEDTSGSKPE